MKKAYYIGMGKFGYAVFYDTTEKKEIMVSPVFTTFKAAHTMLRYKQSIEKKVNEKYKLPYNREEWVKAIGEVFIEGAD